MIDFNLDFDLLDYEEDIDNEELLNTRDLEDNSSENDKNSVNIHDCKPSVQKSFRDLLLRQEILRAISDAGFESPSQVQNECIPQAILGTDILCQAKSGMGKTCVFVLSTLQQLDTSTDKISILVICHTRELAFQISKEYERFSKYMNVNVGVFFGGVNIKLDEQVLAINRPNIVVTTTGRLLALIKYKKINLRYVKHLVIDECDKMLSQEDTLDEILTINQNLPRDKQVMMFTATMNEVMRIICKKFMQNPLEVVIGDDTKLVLHGLQQFYLEITEKEKLRKLHNLLTTINYKQAIVFVSTIQRCISLAEILERLELSVIDIHSGLSQEMRLSGYQLIKNFKKRILVTTKMFDRGIDFERVDLVINYDMPDNSDTYLHAVGRAGRFGTKGVAVSFISNQNGKRIQKEIQKRFDITLQVLPNSVII